MENLINKNKNYRTIEFTGDVKTLMEDYEELKREHNKLEVENRKLKRSLSDISQYAEEVSMDAFTRYMKVENPEYYNVIKIFDEPGAVERFLSVFNPNGPSKEEKIYYDMYKMKRNRFNNIVNSVINNKYEP